MTKNKKPVKGPVRPPARRVSISPPTHDPCKFKIDLDEGSALEVRLDPDGTLVFNASDGRGRVATSWTTSPDAVALLARRLTHLVDTMELCRMVVGGIDAGVVRLETARVRR